MGDDFRIVVYGPHEGVYPLREKRGFGNFVLRDCLLHLLDGDFVGKRRGVYNPLAPLFAEPEKSLSHNPDAGCFEGNCEAFPDFCGELYAVLIDNSDGSLKEPVVKKINCMERSECLSSVGRNFEVVQLKVTSAVRWIKEYFGDPPSFSQPVIKEVLSTLEALVYGCGVLREKPNYSYLIPSILLPQQPSSTHGSGALELVSD